MEGITGGRASLLKGREQESGDHLRGMVSPSARGGIWKEWKWSKVRGDVGNLLGK